MNVKTDYLFCCKVYKIKFKFKFKADNKVFFCSNASYENIYVYNYEKELNAIYKVLT